MAKLLFYLIIAGIALLPISAHAGPYTIDSVELRPLMYETGTVGDPILITKDMFNAMPGGGANFSAAYDLLVTVKMSDAGTIYEDHSNPLLIEARSADGKLFAKRSIDTFPRSQNGSKSSGSILLQDVHCQGALTVKASIGKSQQSIRIPLECGE